ncbi:MAG: D-alanyl-D-alanine carboxypeptidase/D-alanyl-D-alanine-endopeptidase [Planctomycetes bacterium]|nr:D-alanyl-D-alanine carboxypeptidase/D-alanyl-D-alanine-endopeptidase [Planctomycetota bacterium]MCC7170240.1 D-alanyl-D-alanine carboxypeptidase/D-alanyl-D-alanine-endopeptidase [Planctomycetota bacterium]
MSMRRPSGLGVMVIAAVVAIMVWSAFDARETSTAVPVAEAAGHDVDTPAAAFVEAGQGDAQESNVEASTASPSRDDAEVAPRGALSTADVTNASTTSAPAASVEPFLAPRQGLKTRKIARAQLGSKIEAELQRKSLAGASVGIAVRSVTHGNELFARLGSTPLKVASNDKLLTSLSVLEALGANFRFTTRVLARGTISNGVLDGDLVIQGDGDPGDDVLDEALAKPLMLERLVRVVKDAGITRVTGGLIVDDTIFDREYVPPGWPKDQLHKEYCAPVAGFSLCQNMLTVRIQPGKAVGDPGVIKLEPDSGAYEVRNAVKTVAKNGKHEVGLPAPTQPGKVTISGTTPFNSKPEPIRVPVADPAKTAGQHVKRALERAGITIFGAVALTEARVASGAGVRLLGKVDAPLIDRLRVMNKDSTNSVAEHLYKRAGAQLHGVGSAETGGRAVLAALAKHGIDTDGAISEDGSGMGRGNRFTPRQIAALLAVLYRSTHRDAFLDTLPISGVDGTLKNRMDEPQYRQRVRAKTGYITKVSALSGYAQTDAGEVLAFSILINDFDVRKVGNSEMKDVQDDIARLLVDLAGVDS